MWTSRLYLRLWTSPSTSSLWKATDNSWLTTSFQKMGTHPCISSTTHLITIFSTLGHNYDQRNCSNQEYWLRLNKFQLCLKTLTKLDFYKILQFTGIHHLGMSICCTMCTKHLETLKCCLLFFTLFINCVIWSFLINLSNKSFCLLLLFFLPWMDTLLWFLLCWNPG